jgi:hypothetical protein
MTPVDISTKLENIRVDLERHILMDLDYFEFVQFAVNLGNFPCVCGHHNESIPFLKKLFFFFFFFLFVFKKKI